MAKIYSIYCLVFAPFFLNAQTFALHTANKLHNTYEHTSVHNSSYNVQAVDLLKFRGKKVTVCSVVYDAQWRNTPTGRCVTIVVGGQYANERTQVNLRIDENFQFKQTLEQLFVNKYICLSGVVTDNFEKPELWIDFENTQRLVDEALNTTQIADNLDANVDGVEYKLLQDAYLLTGPKWKADVVTHLKAGSVVVSERCKGGWTLVTVMKVAEDKYVEGTKGYLYNASLGLDKRGNVTLPK